MTPMANEAPVTTVQMAKIYFARTERSATYEIDAIMNYFKEAPATVKFWAEVRTHVRRWQSEKGIVIHEQQ